MKFLIVLMCFFSISAFAKVVNPSIENDLDYKVDADTEDQQRSLASGDEDKKTDDEKEENEESPVKKRDLASEKNKLDDVYHDIRFWKY